MRLLIKTIIIFITFIMLIRADGYAAAQNEGPEKEAKKMFLEAKRLIYSKEWQKAVRQFKKITENFSESKWADDSLYWLGYTMNKMSQNLQNLDKALKIKEDAVKDLTLLVKQYPSSKWVDDAKVLRVEIAEKLVTRGLKNYMKFILDAVKEETEMEIKEAVLIVLPNMGKDKAFPIIEKIIRNSKNAELREKAIFVLSQIEDPRVVPLLVEVALKDSDVEVKEQAVFWLGQVRSPESLKQLLKIYDSATGLELKKKVIFSIFQYGGEKAVKELIRIYKKEKSLELKKQVIFWLGNSKREEAQEFILKILE